ncbi:multidrug effflux MFS transporter [Robertmurraya kyonggiensis]|uniref:Bcr/CflA family efflux transporter n=1 Tax=Robertmurraya kyonggiensis TaxID=1037680 RepID=A0A4V5P430_9BACI|nr:multidrug effflux MFS transporter [Robertmurraya kyonggiensis]TKC19010.1 multidrug effflux MFS transporter [Robertmurraya kyonggiensis]
MEHQLAKSIPAKKEKQVGMILVLGFLSALAPFAMDMYLPTLPALASDLQASTSLTQLSLTFCLIGLALGQLIAGPISDARGRRAPLIIGMIIFIVSSILCAFTSSIIVLIVLRLIQGLAGSVGLVVSRAIVRDYYSGNAMTKFFAVLMLVNGVAPIIAPVFGGQMLRFTPWNGVFVVLAIIGMCLLLGVIFKLPESLPRERRKSGGLKDTFSSFQGIMKDRVFMGLSLSQGFVFAAMFAYISGSSFVLQEIFEVSPQVYSAIFGINSIGIVLASQLSSRLSFQFGEKKILAIGLITAVCGSLALLLMIQLQAGLLGVLVPLFVVITSVGFVAPTSTSLAMDRQGRNAGSASALIGLLQMGLGAIATPIVGIGGSLTATPMGLVMAVSTICAIISYLLLARGK